MADFDLQEIPEQADSDVATSAEGEGTRRFKAVFRALGHDERAARRPLPREARLGSRRADGAGPTSIPPAPAELPLLTVGSSVSGAELVLKTEIGDGGMGVIFAASQRSLGREVAVKRLVPEATGDEAIAALVQEARVTGALEHPNVVPVHALGADAHGRPVMVMRRVHGTPWGALLRSRRGSQAGADPGPIEALWGDALTAHLEILIQVANAVWFAHSRGIIHGDIKPDNVMLGSYGEVYVLDWGAALAVRRDDPRGLRWAGDVRTVTGTPAYMAPEMIGMGADISERTDVYLLGAVLHELCTGAPPHAGASMYDLMKRAFVSRPAAYPPNVPRELADICHRAMAPDPKDRYRDVSDMRRALMEHIDHRTSIALGDAASARLEEMLAAMADRTRERRRDVQRLFAECHFGFQQAQLAWRGNADAERGLARAIVAMIEHAIATGDALTATHLAGELSGPHTALRAEVAALAVRDGGGAEGSARATALDPSPSPSPVAARARAVILGASGAGALLALAAAVLPRSDLTRAGIIVAACLFCLAAGAALATMAPRR